MQSASMGRTSITVPAANRWLQLIVGIVCMVMTANLQYGWTLFVHPMSVAHGWAVADIQIGDAPVVLPVQFIERGSSGPARPNKP